MRIRDRDWISQQPQNDVVVFVHSVQLLRLASKHTRNALYVCVPRGSGGSPSHCQTGRQMQYVAPQVSLHSAGVDHAVHDANCDGQVVAAWHVPAVAAAASRIASGSLLSAAASIAGVGAITARAMVAVVSPGSAGVAIAVPGSPAGGS